MMASHAVSSKKQRLTLGQLAAYDDILTDALVDHVFYWTTIRKNRSAYHSSRGVREENVTSILQNAVVVEKDLVKAESQLLALPGLKKFIDALRSQKEKEDFRRHLRRYVRIYLPDCPFEVSSTNRYTIATHEAAITARQFIRKGEVVKYLSGIQVLMTAEEEADIKRSRRDFSIVISSRKKVAAIFLGPARFANHDCGANARLMTCASAGMEIMAIRDIEIGEEITVTYGDNYFGEDNQECLCKTCEDNCRNGWAQGSDDENEPGPKISIEQEPTVDGPSYSFRRKRRRLSSNSSRTQSMTPDINIRPRVVKTTPKLSSRFQSGRPQLEKAPSSEPILASSRRDRGFLLSPLSITPKAARSKFGRNSGGSPLRCSEYVPGKTSSVSSVLLESHRGSPSPFSSADCPTGTDDTSVDEDTIIVETRVPTAAVSIPKPNHQAVLRLPPADRGEMFPLIRLDVVENLANEDNDSSELSDMDSNMEFDESSMTIKARGTTTRRRRKRRMSVASVQSDTEKSLVARYPRDYVLTPTLLAEPASAWINCKICEEPFVQQNAYFTRSSCPRCERHSKLYGYMWPKTDKEDSDDEEERVLDHRTIHRFIRPAEERIIRKRDRAVSGDPRASPAVVEAVVEEDITDVVRRSSRRNKSRKTM